MRCRFNAYRSRRDTLGSSTAKIMPEPDVHFSNCVPSSWHPPGCGARAKSPPLPRGNFLTFRVPSVHGGASYRRLDYGVVAAPAGEPAGGRPSASNTAFTIWSALSVAYHVSASAALFGTSRNAAMIAVAA